MEKESGGFLQQALAADDLEKVPEEVSKKITAYYEENVLNPFVKAKAIAETYRDNIDKIRTDSEQQVNELTLKVQEETAKFLTVQECNKELREQLEDARKEASELTETVKKYESESYEYRKDRNKVIDERDSLSKMVERRNLEIERLESDLKALNQQLKNAINAKCQAQAKYDEIRHKEASLEFKEKSMEQEKNLLNNQIISLKEDLNRNIMELQQIRREANLKTITIETKLIEKTEELKIANSSVSYLTETNTSLTTKVEELSTKMLQQSEESAKMMEQYKKELVSQTRLVDLYKQNCDDNQSQVNELTNAVSGLNKMLQEATSEYGTLETDYKTTKINHSKELEDKDKVIQDLQEELKNANILLEETEKQKAEDALQKFCPTAAATSKIIKSGKSLTEIFTLYSKVTEELNTTKKENQHMQLRLQEVLQEVEERAPIYQRKLVQLQSLAETNEEFGMQIEKQAKEISELKMERDEILSQIKQYDNTNRRLKNENLDLSKQVVGLLTQREENRDSSNYDLSANVLDNIVVFTSVEELQKKNLILLSSVRELTTQMEEYEQTRNLMDLPTYEAKIENYNKRLGDLQATVDEQTKMMDRFIRQRDRYKKMYQDSIKSGSLRLSSSFNGSLNATGDNLMDEDEVVPSNTSMVSSELFQSSIAEKEKKINDLEDQIKNLQSSNKSLKEEYNEYRKEKQVNDKMLNEQFDEMRKELREMSSSNCKLLAQVGHNDSQLQLQQKNIATFKKQIQTLEERNKLYETTIVKHESTLNYLRQDTMTNMMKLSQSESNLEKLNMENRALKESESRLKAEREVLYRERQNQNLLMSNLEMIKTSFERSETEGKMRLETRLDEMTRECSALRRRLQEEQDHFRELSADLKRQTDTAKARMEDEVKIANKLREDMASLRQDIEKKTEKISELSQKLQMSLTPNEDDNPVAQANKKIKELEIKIKGDYIEIESLQKELENTRANCAQYQNLSEASERELNEIHDEYKVYKAKSESELINLRKSEKQLQEKLEEMMTEISLDLTTARLNAGDTNTELQGARNDLKEALTKIGENNRELRALREKADSLAASLEASEQKYANEMILHSNDIKTMAVIKEEMTKTKEQFDDLSSAKEKAEAELDGLKKLFNEREVLLEKEKLELEQRLKNLEEQNQLLLSQIQSFSEKLTMDLSQKMDESMDASLNVSGGGEKSMTEDSRSSDQLLQIIKFLRKEKDIALAKFDILRNENARLKTELELTIKKMKDLEATVNAQQAEDSSFALNAAKHDDLLRKVETLNAITDSNRILREERDNLANKVKSLTDRVTKVEDELIPLQDKNRELTVKADNLSTENSTLRVEATRWRNRANSLVERSNKNSPDDWKRLQTEKETFQKNLLMEKEQHKKTVEEFNALKQDKQKVDQEISNLNRQITVLSADNRRFTDELQQLRQSSNKLNLEMTEIKSKLVLKDEEIIKMQDELNKKEAQVIDAKSKEAQIRKIAKRYKDDYTQLKKKTDENAVSAIIGGENSSGNEDMGEASTSQESEQQIKELKEEIEKLMEEHNKLREENEGLKQNIESTAVNKNLLKEAKQRMVALTETKNQAVKDLLSSQTRVAFLEKAKEEQDLMSKSLKAQYEMRIAHLENENSSKVQEKQSAIDRLRAENDNLAMRIQQLQRQLERPSNKPSTSTEKSSSDASRTANVKPMAGPSQQSATVQPWRGSSSSGDTPLASIRPLSVQNNRTAAVMPTSQTSNIASIQGSSSSGSSTSTPTSNVTALVPPQQQVHTTGSQPGEAMSSSPTSSHTDYMPATSSAGVAVAAVVPMANAAESSSQSQEAEVQNNDSIQIVTGGQQQQQVVALISPRMENAPQNLSTQQNNVEQSPSTSASVSLSTPQNVAMSSHHQASSSNTVTATQAGSHKRPRDMGDSSTSNDDNSDKSAPQKRVRVQGDTFQGVSESGLDVEYQVPTSSQRDQEDVIVVDSDDDEGMPEADEGPFEDEGAENFEMEAYDQDSEVAGFDEGPDIDDDNNIQSANNEVEIDDVPQVPNQSGSSSNQAAPEAGSTGGSNNVVGQSTTTSTTNNAQSCEQSSQSSSSSQNQSEANQQQIQSISSGSEAGPSTSGNSPMGSSSTTSQWRQSPNVSSRQQHTAHLMLTPQNYDETSDDRIVPSTPTLYINRRSDGFAEVVSSPHPQVPHAARFTFNESNQARSSAPGLEGMDDTRVDLSEEQGSGISGSGRSVPSTPQNTSPNENILNDSTSTSSTSSSTSTVVLQPQPEQQQAVAGSSSQEESQVPEISITGADDYDDNTNEDAATTSEGEKQTSSSGNVDTEDVGEVSSENVEEESSEADFLDQPSSNTRTLRSVNMRGGNQQMMRGRGRGGRGRTPIVWQDTQQRNMNFVANPAFQSQRPQRSRRGARGSRGAASSSGYGGPRY